MEQWRKIKGFPNYSVSNKGMVRNDSTKRIISQSVGTSGYMIVGICLNGKQYTKLVHRLVAEAFIGNEDNKKTVNHKNEVKTDNRAENLEWMTMQENLKYGTGRARCEVALRKKIVGTNIETGEQIFFCSLSDAQRNGFSSGNISECCRGLRNKHKGFTWSYVQKGSVK